MIYHIGKQRQQLHVQSDKSFICRGCVNPAAGTGCTSVDIGGDANLELVYLDLRP